MISGDNCGPCEFSLKLLDAIHISFSGSKFEGLSSGEISTLRFSPL